jgi:hypothetical protein
MGHKTAQHGNQQEQISGHEHLEIKDSGVSPGKNTLRAAQRHSFHSAGRAPAGQPWQLDQMNNYFYQGAMLLYRCSRPLITSLA